MKRMIKDMEKYAKKSSRSLASKADKYGLWENFGQDEVRYMKGRFLGNDFDDEAIEIINRFAEWCREYTVGGPRYGEY